MRPDALMQFLNLDFPFLNDEKQSRNEKYICMWTEICDVACVDNFSKEGFDRLDYIRQKLSQFPDLIPYLVETKNNFGKTAFNIASHDVIMEFKNHLYFCGQYEIMHLPVIHQSDTSLVIQAKDHSIVEGIYLKIFNKYKDEGKDTMSKESFQNCFANWNPTDDNLQFRVISSNNTTNVVFDYNNCDLDKCGKVNCHEFSSYCESIFGSTRNVVLKFVKNEDQYRKEINAREDNDLDSKYIMNHIKVQQLTEDTIMTAIQNSKHKYLSGTDYKYMIVMPAADRCLEDIIQNEALGETKKMEILKGIGEAIKYLHSRGIVHGDIKARNIVRMDGDRMKLIDLDASVCFGQRVGAKFSSGVLPPEMFVKLDEHEKNKFEKYFEENPHLMNKIRPVYDKQRQEYYAVKTFLPDKSSDVIVPNKDNLIYASKSFDVWSFGVLMFYMLSTKNSHLFSVNIINNDINNMIDFRKMCEITDNCLSEDMIRPIDFEDKNAYDLILQILRVNPEKRISFTNILEHHYFHQKILKGDGIIMNKLESIEQKLDGRIMNKLESIEQLLTIIKENTLILRDNVSVEMAEKIENCQKILIRSMLNVNEISVPTTIVILPDKLTKSIVAERLNDDMLTKAYNFFSAISKLMIGEPVDYLVDNKCYLYLVDEVNHEVIIPDDSNSLYPIVIDRYPEFIKSIAPFLSIGFKLATMTTRFGSFLEKLGYPNLQISNSAVTNTDSYISKLKKGSSVGEFDKLHQLVSNSITNVGDKNSIQSTRGIDRAKAVYGASLRELTNFFSKNDPKGDFCGLRKVLIFSTGKCCWTTDETYRKLMETEEVQSLDTSLMSILIDINDVSSDCTSSVSDDA